MGMLLRVIAPGLTHVRTHATSAGRAALDDAVLACLARRPRDIPSTLGYFHATPRRHGERASEPREHRTDARLSMPVATVTRRRSGSDLRPSRIKPESAALRVGSSEFLSICRLFVEEIPGPEFASPKFRLQYVRLRSRIFLSGNNNSNAMQNPFASHSLSLGK